jgi:hypothetical protein
MESFDLGGAADFDEAASGGDANENDDSASLSLDPNSAPRPVEGSGRIWRFLARQR